MTALVVALAGTDHHPFDRMVTWIDEAASRHPDVRFIVQHGSATRPPAIAEGHQFLTQDRLTALLAEAAVVVCHGGPGTIMDAREAGHVPLCMPRDPRLGEHVDGHQQRFALLLGEAGVVRAVTTREAFHRELDQALLGVPDPAAVTMATLARDTARARLAAELDGLISQRPHWLSRRHRAPM